MHVPRLDCLVIEGIIGMVGETWIGTLKFISHFNFSVSLELFQNGKVIYTNYFTQKCICQTLCLAPMIATYWRHKPHLKDRDGLEKEVKLGRYERSSMAEWWKALLQGQQSKLLKLAPTTVITPMSSMTNYLISLSLSMLVI